MPINVNNGKREGSKENINSSPKEHVLYKKTPQKGSSLNEQAVNNPVLGKDKKDSELPIYDWIQDKQMIFSEVNKVAGREVREDGVYIHWWTFSGYMHGIDKDSTLAFIVGIRDKLNRRKKLEKYEREFYKKNRDLVDIKAPKTEEEMKQERAQQALLEKVLG